MATQKLRFGNIHIEHPTERDREKGAVSRIFLQLWTEGDRSREVDLTDKEVLALIAGAAKLLLIRQSR